MVNFRQFADTSLPHADNLSYMYPACEIHTCVPPVPLLITLDTAPVSVFYTTSRRCDSDTQIHGDSQCAVVQQMCSVSVWVYRWLRLCMWCNQELGIANCACTLLRVRCWVSGPASGGIDRLPWHAYGVACSFAMGSSLDLQLPSHGRGRACAQSISAQARPLDLSPVVHMLANCNHRWHWTASRYLLFTSRHN